LEAEGGLTYVDKSIKPLHFEQFGNCCPFLHPMLTRELAAGKHH
jgi:hypothetical protein